MEVQGNAELKCIKGPDLSAKAVACDEIPGTVEVEVEQPEDLISPTRHVGCEERGAGRIPRRRTLRSAP